MYELQVWAGPEAGAIFLVRDQEMFLIYGHYDDAIEMTYATLIPEDLASRYIETINKYYIPEFQVDYSK